jgi:hypothetical protein
VGLLPSAASSPQLPLRLKPPLPPPELRRGCCCCCCGSFAFCCVAAPLPTAPFADAPLLPPLRPDPCCFAAAAAVPAVAAATLLGPELALSWVELLTWLSASLAWPSFVSSAAAAAAAVEAALGEGEVRPRLWWRRLRLCGVPPLPLAVLGVDEAMEPGDVTSSACRPAGGVWMGGGNPAGLLGAAAGDPAATARGDLGAQCCVAGAGCGCSLLPGVFVSLLRRLPDAGGVP